MIKKGDFVKIEYTGYVDGRAFDTTSEDIAKKEGIYDPKKNYGPITIEIGAGSLLRGLDEFIEGKEVGKEYDINVEPEKGFGKKDPNAIQLVPEEVFKKANLTPKPGLFVNIDNRIGTIKSLSGGRVLVDFNHPLAGKELNYKLKINKVASDKEIAEAIIRLKYKLQVEELEEKDNKIKIKPKGFIIRDLRDKITEDIKKSTKYTDVEIVV